MKKLNNYITEKLKISSKMYKGYTCQHETANELRKIIKERLAKDKNADLNDIDVSSITDFVAEENGYYGLFYKLDPHNINISEWNVSNATDMSSMFFACKNFNCDLSNWDVSNVRDMSDMFIGCAKFNCDLSKWDVSKFTKIEDIFFGCHSLTNKPSWYHE